MSSPVSEIMHRVYGGGGAVDGAALHGHAPYAEREIATGLWIVFLLWCWLLPGSQAAAAGSSGRIVAAPPHAAAPPYARGDVIAVCSTDVPSDAARVVCAGRPLRIKKTFEHLTSLFGRRCVLLYSSDMSTSEIMNAIEHDGRFHDAVPNYRRRPMQALYPDDTFFNDLWGADNTGQSVNSVAGTPDADMDLPEAWAITTGSPEAVVCVIDTGIDYTHPDLAGTLWTNPGEIPGNGRDDDNNGYVDDVYGYDFAGDDTGADDSDPMDIAGHGTHVAGIIAAAGNNGIGTVGVSWNARLMVLKCARPDGFLYDSDILEAMQYALFMKSSRGINITAINASFGEVLGYNPLLKKAIEAAGEAGIVFCASAGNSGENSDELPVYPAAHDTSTIISVAASDQHDIPAPFSSFGRVSVDIAAPGVNILSTYPSRSYRFLQGTSMAAPQVSGVVALLATAFPDEGPIKLINRIFSSGDTTGTLEGVVAGGKRVNAARALDPDVKLQPFVSGLAPDSGLFPGTVVTLTGSDFGSEAGTVVFSGASPQARGDVVSWDDDHIQVEVPGGLFDFCRVVRPDGGSSHPRSMNGRSYLLLDNNVPSSYVGLEDGGQFVWLNRFAPGESGHPVEIVQVHVYLTPFTSPADRLEIVFLHDKDGDGDPHTAETIYAERFVAGGQDRWQSFTLAAPVSWGGQGDLLIGVINRSGAEGYRDYPAALDSSVGSGNAWIGIFQGGEAPSPFALTQTVELDRADRLGNSGAWLVRGVTRPILKGDVNGDGVIERTDVVLCLKMALGLIADDTPRADMNDDGRITLQDVVVVFLKSRGIEG